MEQQIKQAAKRTRTSFAYFWVLPILLVILGETGGAWVGVYADDVRATYFAETLTILLTASCVPVSLKLFSWVLTKKNRRCEHFTGSQTLCLLEWCTVGIAGCAGVGRLLYLLYDVEQ